MKNIETEYLIAGITFGFIIGVILISILFHQIIEKPLKIDVTDLGNSICKEKYNSKFVSYSDKILQCKKPIGQKYDEITVELV